MKTLKDYPKYQSSPFTERSVGAEILKEVEEAFVFSESERFDSEELFADGVSEKISDVFDFGPTGRKIFRFLFGLREFRSGDKIILNIQECMQFCGYSSKASVYQGLNELLDKSVIAKGSRSGMFHLSPQVFTLHPKIVFVTVYECRD